MWCSCVSVGMLSSYQYFINASFLFYLLYFFPSLFLLCLSLFKLLFFFLSHSFPVCLFSAFALLREATWESDRPHDCADIRLVMALHKDLRLIPTFSFLSSDMQPSRKTPPLYFKCMSWQAKDIHIYVWMRNNFWSSQMCQNSKWNVVHSTHLVNFWLVRDHLLSTMPAVDRKIERCKDAWRHSALKCKASRKPVRHSGTRLMVGHAERQMGRCTAGKSCPWIVSIPAYLQRGGC